MYNKRAVISILLVIALTLLVVITRQGGSTSMPVTGLANAETQQDEPPERDTSTNLPAEAHATLALIDSNGPFPYQRDGITFSNRERLLPQKPRAYYREYTVPTPGLGHRGARRIITGGQPPEVYYYSHDHYRSFTPIKR